MLRWNAQHWTLRRRSDTAFHPAIVSGGPFGETSSYGSGMRSSASGVARSESPVPPRPGQILRCRPARAEPTTSAHDLRGDSFFEARGGLGVERAGDGL